MKEKLTIRKALELLQKIRYYDEKGNMVFLMDEHGESYYINDICNNYEGSSKQIIRKMKIADTLESIGIINVNNDNRNKKTDENSMVSPLIKIKRHNKN